MRTRCLRPARHGDDKIQIQSQERQNTLSVGAWHCHYAPGSISELGTYEGRASRRSKDMQFWEQRSKLWMLRVVLPKHVKALSHLTVSVVALKFLLLDNISDTKGSGLFSVLSVEGSSSKRHGARREINALYSWHKSAKITRNPAKAAASIRELLRGGNHLFCRHMLGLRPPPARRSQPSRLSSLQGGLPDQGTQTSTLIPSCTTLND